MNVFCFLFPFQKKSNVASPFFLDSTKADLLNFGKTTLSASNCVFPYYQGDSTIFDKGNFLYQTTDTKIYGVCMKRQKNADFKNFRSKIVYTSNANLGRFTWVNDLV